MTRKIPKKILLEASADALDEAFNDKSRTIKTISIRKDTYAGLKKICAKEGWKINSSIDIVLTAFVDAYQKRNKID